MSPTFGSGPGRRDGVRVLVLNPGSSSLKGSVVDSTNLDRLAQVEVSLGADATGIRGLRQRVQEIVKTMESTVPASAVEAVGYRVVHGGTRFRSAVLIGPRVLAEIDALREFAPLHNHVAVQTIRAGRSVLPSVPHVAAFDTAFHATLAEPAFIYPLPYSWYRDWKIRRFGFHGLSVQWAVQRAASLAQRPIDQLALVVAHLGSGCSVTAVMNGRSVDTSMGLTPLEGLMMGTRAGSIDPGILLYVLRTRRTGSRQLEKALDHEAGLVGISGRRIGMREVEWAAARGNKRARLAIELFVRKAAAGIAAAATSLPRLDGLVFTGGIGEHSGRIRAAIVERLRPLAVPSISAAEAPKDSILSQDDSPVAVFRVEAREDAVIAAEVTALLSQ